MRCGHLPTTLPLASSDGGEWKRLRSALGRPVVPRKLLDYVPRLDRTAEVFLEVAQESASADRGGFTEDALQLLQRWAMEGEPRCCKLCACCVCAVCLCAPVCVCSLFV